MKVTRGQPKTSIRLPTRSVSLQFRDSQITVKVKSPVPVSKPQMFR